MESVPVIKEGRRGETKQFLNLVWTNTHNTKRVVAPHPGELEKIGRGHTNGDRRGETRENEK